jgi:hypothetical protein
MTIRLIVFPEAEVRDDPKTSDGRHVRFAAMVEGSSEFVCLSRQPLVDGARELLARGYDPTTLLTMRHADRPYDSFEPQPISEWAKWTYSEGRKAKLARVRWMPRPDIGRPPE